MESENDPFTIFDLVRQLKGRAFNAFQKATFLATFFGIVLFLGGMGIWIPIYKNGLEEVGIYLPETLLTYGLAVVASLGSDVILSNSEVDRGQKARRIWGFIIGLVAILLLMMGYFLKHNPTEFPKSSIIATFLVWILWITVNANDSKFDEINEFAPLGGRQPSSEQLGGSGL